METRLHLETHGINLSSHVQDMIGAHLRKLESRFGRITACRVAIRAPGAHHQMGEPYSVSIKVALPGNREVNVGRISHNRDPRQSNIAFAVNDAFRRANRQLRRQAQKLNGDVKQHVGPEGRIASVDTRKSCGFLTTVDGREIYFHAHSVLGGKFDQLAVGDRVAYHEETGENGPQASTVRVLNGGHRV
jgi:cold shock CspA family protein/ribosome-associated translation inhibitor RaiA